MGKYLDPKADITFKKVFGEHPDLLMSLLNALLPLEEDHEIESLEYLPAELIPRTPLTKFSIVDVRCKDNYGRQFIVEMQMEWNSEFTHRVLYNASKTYVMQLDAGMHYDAIQPVYSLNLINDIYEKNDEKFFHHYQMTEKDNPNHIIDGIHLLFFELPKFKPQTISEKKMEVLWLRFLTEINGGTRQAPAELLENAEVNKALAIVEESAFSELELDLYDRFIDAVRWELTKKRSYVKGLEKARAQALAEGLKQGIEQGIQQGIEQGIEKGIEQGIEQGIERGIEKGIEQGIEQGIEKGRAQEKIDIARNLKQSGVPADLIAKSTELSIDEIENL
ncbi:MAG: Rpn family recombination-promoting nuclease/putative transposase [Prevotella sp.]|nr:Rpn family recombination-promoting nuclease/putative transposase [Prevotella sp.]